MTNAHANGSKTMVMGWSIRSRILWPFLALLAIASATIAVSSSYLAARRGERQTLDRVQSVARALAGAGFPLTPNVLEKMSELSGAEFIACDAQGQTIASTLPDADRWARLADRRWRATDHPESLTEAPAIERGDKRYRAARLLVTGAGAGESRRAREVRFLWVLREETRRREAIWEEAWPPLAIGAATLGISIFLASWIAERISGPLQRVRRHLAMIADGRLEELDAGPKRDELRELIDSVNAMVRELRRMQSEIARGERTRVLGQLAAGWAHQWRNAAAGARLAIQLHAKRCSPRADDQSLDVALRQLSLMEEQVKALLSLGRERTRTLAKCDLTEIVRDVQRLVEPGCRHAGVTISGPAPNAKPIRLEGDAESLRAALLNLAQNAIEAAGPGGQVALSASMFADRVEAEVRDNGPGPSRQVADALFEPFVTNKPEGVGLGLTVAKQTADDHGGSLTWERDKGWTRFLLTFPNAS